MGLHKGGTGILKIGKPPGIGTGTVQIAMVAEEERRMISKRTKDALAAAKRRGTQLGGDRPRARRRVQWA
jgi:hypothetical protein